MLKKKKKCCDEYAAITWAIGVPLIVIVALLAILAESQMWVIVPIAVVMVLLGIFMGLFELKK